VYDNDDVVVVVVAAASETMTMNPNDTKYNVRHELLEYARQRESDSESCKVWRAPNQNSHPHQKPKPVVQNKTNRETAN
jgi:hypothetical protein